MNLDEDIKRYLPQYLSDAELGLLKEELAKFTDMVQEMLFIQ